MWSESNLFIILSNIPWIQLKSQPSLQLKLQLIKNSGSLSLKRINPTSSLNSGERTLKNLNRLLTMKEKINRSLLPQRKLKSLPWLRTASSNSHQRSKNFLTIWVLPVIYSVKPTSSSESKKLTPHQRFKLRMIQNLWT